MASTDGRRKTLVSQRKSGIQKSLRSEMELIVDRPKPGYDSTNDGNTARCFFENSTISLDNWLKWIIKRIHIILQTISNGYDINV